MGGSMSSSSKKNFAKKHSIDTEVDENIKKEILARLKNKGLPCAVAFAISTETDTPIAEIGMTADLIQVKLIKCQLGLFGYQPGKKVVSGKEDVDPTLKRRIVNGVSDGRLSCQKAWEIASRSDVPKMRVSNACEAMNVKIAPCQLGAF
jgi:hypothetical protein